MAAAPTVLRGGGDKSSVLGRTSRSSEGSHACRREHNRGRILLAARQVFGHEGPDVPLERIAGCAGAGIATLYRRFPSRGALIRAVAVEVLEALYEAATDAAPRESDPFEALRRFMHAALDSGAGTVVPSLFGRVEFVELLDGLRPPAAGPHCRGLPEPAVSAGWVRHILAWMTTGHRPHNRAHIGLTTEDHRAEQPSYRPGTGRCRHHIAGVAEIHAQEHRRPDRLFTDLYAQHFPDASGEGIAAAGARTAAAPELFTLMADQAAVSTRFLDDVLLGAARGPEPPRWCCWPAAWTRGRSGSTGLP